MQHDGHERETCRQDRACWSMDSPRFRCFVLELGVKLTQGVHSAALSLLGSSFLGSSRKSWIPRFLVWVRKFAGGIMKEARDFIWKARTFLDALIFCSNEGFFSDQLGGTPMWKIPHCCSCLMVCKSFISVGTTKWFCNSPNQKN